MANMKREISSNLGVTLTILRHCGDHRQRTGGRNGNEQLSANIERAVLPYGGYEFTNAAGSG